MWTLLCLLSGSLLAMAQTAGALTCYKGNHTTVTSDFPTGADTCVSMVNSCVEKRRKNWETNPGFFELYFGCGKCGAFDSTTIDCHECSADNCNSDYGKELEPNITKLTMCYSSLKTIAGPLPVPVFCPKDQKCTSSANPNDAEHFLVGCQPHCQKLNWQNCRDCNSDLCNLKDRSNGGSLVTKFDMPTPPPSAAPVPSLDSFDTSGDKSEMASSAVHAAAQPIALAAAFAAAVVTSRLNALAVA